MFTDKIAENSIEADEAEKEIEGFIEKNENVIHDFTVTNEQVLEVINELGNGKSVGISGASNEMF